MVGCLVSSLPISSSLYGLIIASFHFSSLVLHTMGCIPSKQQVMDSDAAPVLTSRPKPKFFAKLKPSNKKRRPPSAVVEAPWVKGHKVFVLDKSGNGAWAEPMNWEPVILLCVHLFRRWLDRWNPWDWLVVHKVLYIYPALFHFVSTRQSFIICNPDLFSAF